MQPGDVSEQHRILAQQGLLASRIVFGTFGFVFAAIGLLVIGFLWLTPFNQFGSPPLFFRIFGTLIAICFVAMGTTTFIGAIAGKLATNVSLGRTLGRPRVDDPAIRPTTNYACPNCGAQLGAKVDVSPLGDAKCAFCHQWFNIHRPAERSH